MKYVVYAVVALLVVGYASIFALGGTPNRDFTPMFVGKTLILVPSPK